MNFLFLLIKVAHLHFLNRMRYLIVLICGGNFSSGSSHVSLIYLFLEVGLTCRFPINQQVWWDLNISLGWVFEWTVPSTLVESERHSNLDICIANMYLRITASKYCWRPYKSSIFCFHVWIKLDVLKSTADGRSIFLNLLHPCSFAREEGFWNCSWLFWWTIPGDITLRCV